MRMLLLAMVCLISIPAFSQNGYTYVSDRHFYTLDELIGYDFRPAAIGKKDGGEREIRPGEYSFGVTQRNLYVEGPVIRGVYNISTINTTEYGYQIKTINARDARLQGHLKIITNKYAEVEALIFRKSKDHEEIVFFQAYIPEDLAKKERGYFTDRKELQLMDKDSIWGTTIVPFFRMHTTEQVQERLQIADSTWITFIEEIILEEKVIEKKPPKKKKKKKGEEEVAEIQVDTMPADTSLTEIKIKEIRNYYMDVRAIISYDDGTKDDKTFRYPIKKIVEREDASAGDEGERFQLEITSPKANEIYLYLTGYRTVSSIQIDDKMYLVRGY